MFDNISGKIKMLAKVSTCISITCFIIYGIVLMLENFFVGLLVMVLGSLFAWISAFAFYGFGELIEQVEISNRKTSKIYDFLKDNQPEKNNTFAVIKEETDDQSNIVKVVQQTYTKDADIEEHKWLCNSCGKLRSQSPCPYCGNE